VPVLAVNLVPCAVARYSMPALVPASWLLAMSYVGGALHRPHGMGEGNEGIWAKIVAAFVGLGVVVGAIGYPLTAEVLRNSQQVKKAAAQINAVVPGGETFYAVNPDYQPVFFYVKAPLKYVSYVKDLPADTHYFLVQTNNEAEAAATEKWRPRHAHQLARIRDYPMREMILFEVGP